MARRYLSTFGLFPSGDVTAVAGGGSSWSHDGSRMPIGTEGTLLGMLGSGFAFRRGNRATQNFVTQQLSLTGGVTPSASSHGLLDRVLFRPRAYPSAEEQWCSIGTTSANFFIVATMRPDGWIQAYLYQPSTDTFPGVLQGAAGPFLLGVWYESRFFGKTQADAIHPTTEFEWRFRSQDGTDPHVGTPFTIGGSRTPPIITPAFTRVRLGAGDLNTPATHTGLEIDFADWIGDDLGDPSWATLTAEAVTLLLWQTQIRLSSRVEVRRPIALGTYQNWVDGGLPDLALHSALPPVVGDALTSTTALAVVSYAFGALQALGIQGGVTSIRPAVYFATVGSGTHDLLLRVNGVDTFYPITVTSQTWGWKVLDIRADLGGNLLPTDLIEVGVRKSNDGTSVSIAAVCLEVETDTNPLPTTLPDPSDNTIQLAYGAYVGTGATQTIACGFVPHWVVILPVVGATGNGVLWCDQDEGGTGFCTIGTEGRRMALQSATGFTVVGTDAASNNAGTTYEWIAIRDPQARCLARGSYTKTSVDTDAVIPLVDSGYNPLYLWAKALSWSATGATPSFVRGPGHVGASSSPLSAAQVSTAIRALTSGSFTSGTSLNQPSNSFPGATYTAWRSSAFTTGKRWNATSYVGDGTGARTIAIDLSGKAPLFAIVTPHDGASFVRMPGLAATASYSVGAASVSLSAAAGITGGGPNSLTVATGLNALGVTYEVFALAGPFDTPGWTPAPPPGTPQPTPPDPGPTVTPVPPFGAPGPGDVNTACIAPVFP